MYHTFNIGIAGGTGSNDPVNSGLGNCCNGPSEIGTELTTDVTMNIHICI